MPRNHTDRAVYGYCRLDVALLHHAIKSARSPRALPHDSALGCAFGRSEQWSCRVGAKLCAPTQVLEVTVLSKIDQ
jgi:hypothetical protein